MLLDKKLVHDMEWYGILALFPPIKLVWNNYSASERIFFKQGEAYKLQMEGILPMHNMEESNKVILPFSNKLKDTLFPLGEQ